MSKKLLVLVTFVAVMTSSCAIFITDSCPFESDDQRDTIKIIVDKDQDVSEMSN